MITFDGSIYIHRPARTVFDVVGTRLFETQPMWEDGIVAIHPLTEGPIRVGTKAVMERLDLGVWRRRTNYQCVAFEQDRLLVFYNDSPGIHVEFRLSVAPVGEQGTLLRFVLLATFTGAMRLLEPLAAVMLGPERRKTLRDIKAYVESNPTADTRSRPGVGSQKVLHLDPERTRMKVLASVSLVQLIVQLLAARKAIRDRIPYDIPFAHGEPQNVEGDMWTKGSGLAAPWPMLAAHAAVTTLLFARPRPWLRRTAGVVGAAYILGILWERVGRESLRHPDTETTPLVAAGLALSVAMARLGLVPDARTAEFKHEAQRQAREVAASDRATDDQDFVKQISEDWPE
jgi:hypothetical protein